MIVECTKTGYSAYAKKYPVATTGKHLHQLRNNMIKALNLYFADDDKIVTEDDLKIALDIPQFFEFYKVINAKALSERIGMNQSLLAQYIGGQKKPSALQAQRILHGINQVGKELAEVSFIF